MKKNMVFIVKIEKCDLDAIKNNYEVSNNEYAIKTVLSNAVGLNEIDLDVIQIGETNDLC